MLSILFLPFIDVESARNSANCNTFGLFLLSALLALPPFVLALFISGLSDHFFETPFDQFRWTDVDVREQVVRDLLGPLHPPITNLRTDQHKSLVSPVNSWPKFFPRPLIEPTCRHSTLSRRNSLLIIVKSAPDRLKHRDAVRATYGALKRYPPPASVPTAAVAAQGAGAAGGRERATDTLAGNAGGANGGTFFRLRTIFVLGRPAASAADATAQMAALEREAATHGDLLVGDFVDTYFNNTLKFVHSVRFARHHCALSNSVPFVLLLDDDYLLFPWNLVAELQRHVPNERLYMGWRFDTSPFRSRLIKWRVSLDEFPFDAFPPYIAAGAVLLTGQTIAEFYAAIPHVRLFRFDDIYTGILVHLLAITPQHNANFAFYRQTFADLLPSAAANALIAVHDYSPEEIRKVYEKTFQNQQQLLKKKQF